MDFDQECINDFIEESVENLDMLDEAFIQIEKEPGNSEELDKIFRVVHTMKGGCRLIGMARLERITHIAETLLDLAREKEILLDKQHISLLLKTVDVLRHFVSHLRETNKEAGGDYELLVEQLEKAAKKQDFDLSRVDVDFMKSEKTMDSPTEDMVVPEEKNMQSVTKTVSEDGVDVWATEEEVLWDEKIDGNETPVGELNSVEILNPTSTQKNSIATSNDKRFKLPALVAKEEVRSKKETPVSAAENTIRIDVKRLDKLMDLVGELVLSRNQLKQVNIKLSDALLNGTTNAISLITSELQEEIVKSRLQPISSVLNKFQRTVRDMAESLGKEVELELHGVGTELDRTLLESIKDPLTHLIRNSVDHGIEIPKDRELRKKPRCGKISIQCYHDGGQVMIEIRDDGGGLDAIKIGAKALSRKLVSKERLEKMTPKEIYRFIFQAGFSTVDVVTNLSGRGVGMDVVHTNITAIGGQIDLDSTPGKETVVRLQIPLTLAIIPALMVKTDGRYFSIPQNNLQELIFLDKVEYSKIEKFDKTEVYRLRGQLLPLLRLRPLMKLENENPDYLYIVVLVSGEQKFGLIVDEVEDTEEIVVKPLAKFFNKVRYFSGATILGDGAISLILDVDAIAQASHLSQSRNASSSSNKSISRTKAASTALIFHMGGEERLGIQMSQISRLEEIKTSDIEKSGRQEVIQYRGQILPIVRLSRFMDIDEYFEGSERLSLIVFNVGGRETGLLVKEIEDAIGLEGDLDTSIIEHPLILGTMTLKGMIVLMLDALKVFEMAFPRWIAAPRLSIGQQEVPKLLYVDDSSFYLKVVSRYLMDSGYEIDVAMNGHEGLAKIKKERYNLLLIDYEMPGMDGLELIGEVRKLPDYDLVPIIVLTALTGGREKFSLINSGIQSYLVKLNKEDLLREIKKLLEMEPVEV